ncbi:MAG: hypothetical protein KGN76_16765 [Acidobacteriota bacterium]|nr:hypothetical protein [Acidobacteriota bacterium]
MPMTRDRAAVAVLTVALACAALLSASCESALPVFIGSAGDTWTRSYPLQPGGQVDIANTDGDIDAQGWDGPTVEVTVDRSVRASSQDAAREALRSLVIKESIAPDRVGLDVANPPGDVRVLLTFHVKVPRLAGLRLTVADGRLQVANVAGPADLQTTNGPIDARVMAGPVSARTTNGRIAVDFDAIGLTAGPMRLQTVNGGIDVTMPRNGKVDLSARAGHGGIDVSGKLPIELDVQAPHRFEGRLNGGGARLVMETGNGSIRIGSRP